MLRIDLFGQSGGGIYGACIFGERMTALERLCNAELRGPYSEVFEIFVVIFRVDGEFVSWNEDGISRMRVLPGEGYAKVDANISQPTYAGKSDAELDLLVFTLVEQGFRDMERRIRQRKLPFDWELFWADWENVRRDYLRPNRRKVKFKNTVEQIIETVKPIRAQGLKGRIDKQKFDHQAHVWPLLTDSAWLSNASRVADYNV